MRLPLPLWAFLALQLDTAAAQEQRPPLLPMAIRKMPPDQGAKFHPSYYAFSPPPPPLSSSPPIPGAMLARSGLPLPGNASSMPEFLPPFAVSWDDDDSRASESELEGRDDGENGIIKRRLFGRAAAVLGLLRKRQWACPAGTSGCGAIGYPNSCCRDGETCVEVQDTGLGPVGCCPAGATCAGGVMACTDGSTPCGSDIGGGCCIPGYVCQGVGCVKSQSATPTPSPSPGPTAPTGVTTMTSTLTSIVDAPNPSTVIVTVVVTVTPTQSPPRTSTLTQTVSAPSPSPTPSSDTGIGAPYRPTSSLTDGGPATFCPTGFYACLASAGGGCCQTGRNCETTSCPPVSMTTIVTANGVTIVVPASGVPAPATGQCADGWFMCGADAGPVPGCCPSGYRCGTASCSVVADGATATVAKALPDGGSSDKRIASWVGWVVGIVGGLLVW